MTALFDFLKENEKDLSELERDVLTAGLYVINTQHKVMIRDMETKYTPETTLHDVLVSLDLGVIQMYMGLDKCKRECSAGDLLVLLWKYLMPEYELVGREVNIPGAGRADIIAKDADGVFTVIELKNADVSAEKKAPEQVNRYARALELHTGKPHNVLIINNTGIWSDEVEVITWYELGIFNNFAYAPDSFDINELAYLCKQENIKPKQVHGRYAYPYKVLWNYIHSGMD